MTAGPDRRFLRVPAFVLPGVLGAILGACAPQAGPYRIAPLPHDTLYAAYTPAGHTRYSNESLAEVFTELTHGMEWGASRPGLVRFEGPVTVHMTGAGSAQYATFLEQFLGEIRARAKLDINRGGPESNIQIEFVPGAQFTAWTSNQCVIVFGQPGWQALLKDPDRYGAGAFEAARTQEVLTIIIPNTSPPHEIRECLMEEISQALGPANDLYGLGDSIFNDDNAHTWPTKLDYLMLRVLYNLRMTTGMDRHETRSAARVILDEIHPEGRDELALPLPREAEFANWRARLQGMPTLGSDIGDEILETTQPLLDEAARRAPNSAYHCESLTLHAVAKHHLRDDDPLAALQDARDLCAEVHGSEDVRLSQIDLYIAVEHLDEGKYAEAIDVIGKARDGLLGHGQEGLVASSYVITWAAHLGAGNEALAELARQNAVAWSAYAFGSDSETVQEWSRY